MSFAYDVKQELAQRSGKSALLRAQGYGLFLFSRVFSRETVVFQTENEFAIQIAADYLKSQHISAICEELPPTSINPVLYRMEIQSPDSERLLDSFGSAALLPVNDELFASPKALSFFLGGAFMACGNITDPQKSYHLEFVTRTSELADVLEELVGEITPCRRSNRKGVHVVYLKDSEQIADLLTFLGATRASLSLMETKIVKEVRNRTNRQVNCETANLSKTAAAAVSQCNDIRLIADTLGWDALPEELRALAHARLEQPGATLRELGESLLPPLSRSGVAHRFERLHEIAEGIRLERRTDNSANAQ